MSRALASFALTLALLGSSYGGSYGAASAQASASAPAASSAMTVSTLTAPVVATPTVRATVTDPLTLNPLAPSVQQGETLRLSLTSAQSGYVTLLLERQGRPQPLLVLTGANNVALKAAEACNLELPTQNFPVGRSRLLAVYSPAPISSAQTRAAQPQPLLSLQVRPAVGVPTILDLRPPLYRPATPIAP